MSGCKMLMKVLLLMLACLIGTVTSSAEPTSSKILSIEVEGNRYVEHEMVLSKMGTKVGDLLSRKQLSRDVRALHKTGMFSDVRFSGRRTEQGIYLTCKVQEYPLIAKVDFEGNDEHTAKDLQQKMKLKPGRMFSPDNRESDLNTIRKGYLKDGYYQVGVNFVTTPLEDGRVNLLIKINEGDVTTIKRINFIGNEVFSDEVLRDEIASRQSNAVSWFTDRDLFDQKRLGADSQLIEQYYLNNGYLDIRVDSTRMMMTPDKQTFNLTFTLYEGPQYRINSIGLQGDLVPDKETLEELIEMEVGRVYALSDLRESIDAITARVGDEGYAFATVTPLLTRNLEMRTVDIIFDIEKGDEVYVERIEIVGNNKTDDEVLRRLIVQDEGARYSGSQVKRSKDELGRAAFTEDVRVALPKGSADDKVVMQVDVTENKTGSFSAGVGYSELEKLTLTGSVKEQNAFGKGYMANLEFSLGALTQNYNVSLTDPFFLNENLSASVNLFKTQTDQLNATNYIYDSVGGGVGFGVPVSEHFTYGINYRYERSNMQIVNIANASRMLLSQTGRQTTGEVSNSLTWDSRNLHIGTTEGHQETLRFSVAGAGGDNRFAELEFTTHQYYGFGEESQFVFNPNMTVGGISGYANRAVPLYRRYSLGGIGSVRGFDSLGISLRDPLTNEAVGGDKQLMASVNLFFPMPYMQTAGIRGVAFIDSGTVWGKATVVNVTEKFSASRVRISTGFGLEWLSPVGPIGLSWGFPIRKMQGDLERSFEFSLGGQF